MLASIARMCAYVRKTVIVVGGQALRALMAGLNWYLCRRSNQVHVYDAKNQCMP